MTGSLRFQSFGLTRISGAGCSLYGDYALRSTTFQLTSSATQNAVHMPVKQRWGIARK
jgi:hypothetical protein